MLTFQKGAAENESLSYPLVEIPPTSAGLVDPHIGVDHNLSELLAWGKPEFEEQKDLFRSCRGDVTQDVWPQEYINHFHDDLDPGYLPPVFTMTHANEQMPLVVTDMPVTAALLVQMDRPTDLGNYLFDWLWSIETPVRRNNEIVRNGAHNFYLNAFSEFTQLLGANVEDIYHKFMEAKFFHGIPRPEEYFDLPGCIVTEYAEGCPTHPAFPAGHGAYAGRVYRVLMEFFEIIDEGVQRDLWLSVWFFAHFRTFAGVHWPMDNEAGLMLGRRDIVKVGLHMVDPYND